MSISGNKPGSENISGWAATKALQDAVKKLAQFSGPSVSTVLGQKLVDHRMRHLFPEVDGNECLNPPPKMEFPDPDKSWEDLGKLMARQVYETAYDPLPHNNVRGLFLLADARGDFNQRAAADKLFKENCKVYAELVGQDRLIERLKDSALISECATELNIPIESVTLSQAVSHRDHKQMKVMLSLAGEQTTMPNVICGFPGVGKSTLFRNRGDLKILDSDSSTFDKAEFPQNYIAHIKEKIAEGYIILASTHDVVRNALVENNIPFGIVYPALNCKEEYLQRYRDRGSPQAFIDLMDAKWVDFVNGCASQKGCISYCMPKGQYMPSIEELPKKLS
jgi:hypothetical protein